MVLFEDIEDPANDDRKISLVERAIILAFVVFAKVALRKARKAKTYGDIRSILTYVDTFMEDMDKKFPQINDNAAINEENAQAFAAEVESAAKTLDNAR